MNFHGPATALTPYDLDEAARMLDVSVAHIRAVMKVEARGKGFLRDGRPVILFEPHVFHRELPLHKRAGAMRQGLACKDWGDIPYPKTVSGSYDRLEKAMMIDAEAALRSCSWGLGQVMGFNHRAAGFDDIYDFVTAMMQSEGAQLMAMMSFIRVKRLDDELRREDWTGFARGYNGAGFRRNRYHTKLARAYAQYKASNDNISTPRLKPKPDWLGRGAKGKAVRDLQEALNALGQFIRVDGDFGDATRDALMQVQRELGLRPDGLYGARSRRAIADALVRRAQLAAEDAA